MYGSWISLHSDIKEIKQNLANSVTISQMSEYTLRLQLANRTNLIVPDFDSVIHPSSSASSTSISESSSLPPSLNNNNNNKASTSMGVLVGPVLQK